LKKENITLEFGNIKYFDKSLDLSILEIKKIKNKNIKYIEFDDYLYVKDSEFFYNKESIYTIYYGNKDIYISYGIINNLNKSELRCSCNVYTNSSGFPIFNLNNNKLIGLYVSKSNYFIKGIFFKFIIKELINEIKYEFKYKENIKNEINILINIGKNDINKKIYFLDNYEYKDNEGIIHIHDNLKELNEYNTELYIDRNKEKYEKYYIPKKEGEFKINLKFNINLNDCSYMFAGCEKIMEINFNSFNTKFVKAMKYMFCDCKNLKSINLYSFDTKNVSDMSYMFYHCNYLRNLDLSSFNTKNVITMSHMFNGCKL